MDISDLDKKICGAKTRSGGICKGRPMENGRRRLHGGKTPRGMQSPHWRDGRYSKYVPPKLIDLYQEALNDRELLNLQGRIALLDTRLVDLIRRLEENDSDAILDQLKVQWGEFLDTLKNNPPDANNKLQEIGKTIMEGEGSGRTWDQIQKTLALMTKMVESERKRAIELGQYLTSEQGLMLLQTINRVIREHIPSSSTRQKIADELYRLSLGPGNQDQR